MYLLLCLVHSQLNWVNKIKRHETSKQMKIINDVKLKGGKISKNRIIRSIIIEEEQFGNRYSQINFILN